MNGSHLHAHVEASRPPQAKSGGLPADGSGRRRDGGDVGGACYHVANVVLADRSFLPSPSRPKANRRILSEKSETKA
jgi:hypothetical protein